MKRFLKWAFFIVLILAVAGFCAFLYVIPPFFIAPPETFSKAQNDAAPTVAGINDPAERAIAEHGRYLVVTATNQMAIGWPAVVGQRYQMQYVNALSPSNNWQNLGAQVSARLTNVVTQVQMSGAKAFYRVAQVP